MKILIILAVGWFIYRTYDLDEEIIVEADVEEPVIVEPAVEQKKCSIVPGAIIGSAGTFAFIVGTQMGCRYMMYRTHRRMRNLRNPFN